MHIGILTGGGDCPGLNAVIRAATLALVQKGVRVSGIERGFLGLMRRRLRPLSATDVDNILDQGGTILGTHNKADPFHDVEQGGADVSAQVLAFAREQQLDAVLAIGGDGTMGIADRLNRLGLPMIGVPKTIDNDLVLTERTFGFDSAVAIVAEAIGRLRTTSRAHGRVMIVETMGRYAGWIALEGGLAGGADAILLPEIPFDLPRLLEVCRRHEDAGPGADDAGTIICVAEGAMPRGGSLSVAQTLSDSPDPIRLGGVGEALRKQLAPLLRSEVRTTLLGHVQRGGSPTAFDRVLATRFGHAAAWMALAGQHGQMVALQSDACVSVALAEVAGRTRTVPLDHPLLAAARGLGVCLGD
ncbi:MAG: ATP-dependent 6-phosphofructokinase [Rubrivivax sp.]|nr:ATP-dependent 6-phosphofructokinase [Rubrivivax sp.]